YFANRYGLTQHSIQWLSPEAEVSPQQIQQIIELARGRDVDTIYSEDLIDPRLANVIAQEIPNGKVLVLSPIEGINKEEQNAGEGYLNKMRENLEILNRTQMQIIQQLTCEIYAEYEFSAISKCELFNDRIQVLYEVDLLALNIISLILMHISQCCGQLS
ncbi:MAG TPA: zinc ABC transporter substrate-binding protein, partial [Nitrososphaeraceae archaeon]|nr:zinc ABC transporter substrate-binding protein [Nitrososphaeraceae archaeon]